LIQFYCDFLQYQVQYPCSLHIRCTILVLLSFHIGQSILCYYGVLLVLFFDLFVRSNTVRCQIILKWFISQLRQRVNQFTFLAWDTGRRGSAIRQYSVIVVSNTAVVVSLSNISKIEFRRFRGEINYTLIPGDITFRCPFNCETITILNTHMMFTNTCKFLNSLLFLQDS